MALKSVKSLSEAELSKYQQKYKAQLLEEDNVLILDMTKKLLKDIEQEIKNRQENRQ